MKAKNNISEFPLIQKNIQVFNFQGSRVSLHKDILLAKHNIQLQVYNNYHYELLNNFWQSISCKTSTK